MACWVIERTCAHVWTPERCVLRLTCIVWCPWIEWFIFSAGNRHYCVHLLDKLDLWVLATITVLKMESSFLWWNAWSDMWCTRPHMFPGFKEQTSAQRAARRRAEMRRKDRGWCIWHRAPRCSGTAWRQNTTWDVGQGHDGTWEGCLSKEHFQAPNWPVRTLQKSLCKVIQDYCNLDCMVQLCHALFSVYIPSSSSFHEESLCCLVQWPKPSVWLMFLWLETLRLWLGKQYSFPCSVSRPSWSGFVRWSIHTHKSFFNLCKYL